MIKGAKCDTEAIFGSYIQLHLFLWQSSWIVTISKFQLEGLMLWQLKLKGGALRILLTSDGMF